MEKNVQFFFSWKLYLKQRLQVYIYNALRLQCDSFLLTMQAMI